nr:MAG TPA: hypothetical protein [Caudoviricetes sp.]
MFISFTSIIVISIIISIYKYILLYNYYRKTL